MQSTKSITEASKLIASFLKDNRTKLGLSQEALAALCGVKRQTIQRIEHGVFMPNLKLFLIILESLNYKIVIDNKLIKIENYEN